MTEMEATAALAAFFSSSSASAMALSKKSVLKTFFHAFNASDPRQFARSKSSRCFSEVLSSS